MEFYKVIHLIGVLLVYVSLGLLIARAYLGAAEASPSLSGMVRKWGAIFGGIGLFLLLLGGFGMIARYKGLYSYVEWWLICKYIIWLILGAMTTVINRLPHLAALWFAVVMVLGIAGTLLGVLHPR